MRYHNRGSEKIPYTQEEEDARDAEEAAVKIKRQRRAVKRDERASKLAGVDLGGTMCSATRHDQNGLAAISVGILFARGAGSTFPDTKFEFQNGAELLITDSTFDRYYSTWVAFRQSFFAP